MGKDTATELFEAQQKRAQSEIEDIEKTKGGKVRKVWEIKKKVLGGKKTDVEATAITDPKTGNKESIIAIYKRNIDEQSYRRRCCRINRTKEGRHEKVS